MRRRLMLAALATTAAVVGLGGIRDAAACGGLVAPNGAVRLARATTLTAWHDGVEHYLTSFAYQGDVEDVGWIVPLPAVPESVVKGGSWSLQRLGREARPVAPQAAAGAGFSLSATDAEVVMTTTVDSLDITVLRGSGQAVVDWCATNHFTLSDETRAHILAYAQASPVFMAAKYDTHAARLRGFFQGDGTPVLITMRTPHLWIPLEVLANAGDPLSADLYLFTDERPTSIASVALTADVAVPGAPGLRLLRQEQIPAALHDDLAAQQNMAWVPRDGWFTALSLNAPGDQVTYDLTAESHRLALAPMGMGPGAIDKAPPEPGINLDPGLPASGGWGTGLLVAMASLGLGVLAAGIGAAVMTGVERHRRRAA